MGMNINIGADTIDSRDIIEELNELEQELIDHIENGGTEENFDKNDMEDLEILRSWNDLGDDINDWDYGVQLIHDNYFQEYVEQLVEDIGDIPDDLPYYIKSNIDWKGVAEAIQQDYTPIELSYETYWVR
jgi:hypothetical protein